MKNLGRVSYAGVGKGKLPKAALSRWDASFSEVEKDITFKESETAKRLTADQKVLDSNITSLMNSFTALGGNHCFLKPPLEEHSCEFG